MTTIASNSGKRPICIDCKKAEADPHGPRCQLCFRLNYRKEQQPRWHKIMETLEAILLAKGRGAIMEVERVTGIERGILNMYRKGYNRCYNAVEHVLILQEYCHAELVKMRAKNLSGATPPTKRQP